MDVEDLEEKKEKPKPINLEIMSVEALNIYIQELEIEINRVKDEISAKKAAKVGAESFFKK